jgi:RNA polymerase sigma-70 factor (ECF subfamily)
MELTSTSLLVRACEGSDPVAWERLVAIYRPMIIHWMQRYAISHQDSEDLAQDVLTILIRELPCFAHSGRPGAFRAWLRAIAANRMRSFWRSGRCRPSIGGDGGFMQMVEQLEDDNSDLSRLWDEEHDRYVVMKIVDAIEREFRSTTMDAFRRVTIDHQPPVEVAASLGLSVSAVYIANSRVLRRLRKEAEGLIL